MRTCQLALYYVKALDTMELTSLGNSLIQSGWLKVVPRNIGNDKQIVHAMIP